jgi:hypothetical protein
MQRCLLTRPPACFPMREPSRLLRLTDCPRWRRRTIPPILLVVLAGLLASCGIPTSRKELRAATLPSAPRLEGTGEVDAVPGSGGNVTWLVLPDPASIAAGPGGNARPDWLVERLAGGKITQVTPQGITVRGGVAVSALPGGRVAWVGVGSYRYQLDGAVAVTTDGGRHWSATALSVPLAPAPQGIVAESSRRAVVLGGLRARRELLVTSDAGATWVTSATSAQLLGTDARRCTLEGLGPGTEGAVLVGTRCQGPTGLLVTVTATGQVQRARVGVPGARGGITTVLPFPEPVPASARAMATLSWEGTAVPGGVLEAGFVDPTSSGELAFSGTPATITGGLTLLGGAIGPGGDQVLLAGRDLDRFLHPGPDEVLAREGTGASWQFVAPVRDDGFTLVADGLGFLADGGELLAVGSAQRSPALASTPSSGSSGLLSGEPKWSTQVLLRPQIATASSLS